MLTYVGRGYSRAFTEGYDRIVARLAAGEAITIVAGPDAICAPLMCRERDPHCLRAGAAERDRRAARDVSALLRRSVVPGETFGLDADDLAALRRAFAAGAIRDACQGCQWSALCTAVAEGGFATAKLDIAGQSKERA